MDRTNAHEAGYRELLGLRNNNTPATATVIPSFQDSSLDLPKSANSSLAQSQQYGNGTHNDSIAFHGDRMSSPKGNAGVTTPVISEGSRAANISTETGFQALQQRNASGSRNPTSARGRGSGLNAGRGGIIYRSGAAEDATVAQRAITSTIHEPTGGRDRHDLQRGAPVNAGPFRGGRGRALDISHARGRGRGDFGDNRTHIAEDISEREGTRNHELGRGHHRGGGFKEGHRGRFGHGAGRGRGRGHIEYDADFDRGKTTQDRRAESQKQLFQAPMGYKSEFASDPTERRAESATRKDNHHLRENGKQDTRSAQVAEPEHRHSEDEGRRETQPTDLRDLQEATATPGLINTGIDVTATQGDSRKGKQGGERKQRGRGREGRDRRSARDASSDGRQGRERDDPGRSFDVNASVHPVERPPFPVGVPPPPHPFERVPPPFMPPPPPPPAGPYDQYHGRPPPPPDAFFRFPFGPPMPPPGEGWPHSPHGSPPFRHRGPPPPFLPDSQEQGSASRHNRSMKPDSIPGALKGQVTRSVRDASSRYSQDRDTDGTGSPLPAARQLFDPTKHDPVKFSSSKSAALSSTGTSASTLDDRSVAVSSTRSNMSSLSVASSDYKSRHSSQKDALLDEVESTSSGAGDNALLRELKASYKEILSIEAKLQDEDKFAKTAIEEEAEASGREDLRSPKETRSDEYWTQLIQLHREGCEAFHSFIERCMDPMVPASIHSIPQKYNLPGRMWKSAFFLLLERLQSALSQHTSEDTSSVEILHSGTDGGLATCSDLLDHVVDFVHYAYAFYTQLLEQQSLQVFRGTWIEHLGDVARYRMSVAEIASKMPPTIGKAKTSTNASSLGSLLEGDEHNAILNGEVKREVEYEQTPKKQLITRKDRKKGFPGLPAKLPEDLELADTPGNSIGAAALDDWELIEQDIWRTVAQEWYFLGLSETPGTGRLHHHLATIAQDDELRALYHYAKSTTASHPYSAGFNSISAFFSPERQASRLQPDAPASSLFVHLHGLLYVGTDLDAFDAILARLQEKLEASYIHAQSQAGRPVKKSIRGKLRDDASRRLNRDSTWMMMAVVNMCALMEYGKDGSALKSVLSKAHDEKKSEKQSTRADKKALQQSRSDPTPSEASLTDLAKRVERLGLEASKARLALTRQTDSTPPPVSRTLRLAMRFTFSLLKHTLRYPMKPADVDPAICPYITVLFTFLATLASNKAAFAVIRSEVPWEAIVQLLESLPKYARDLYLRDESNVPNRLLGITLPEDWCIRGLEWTGKQLFGRGYWKGKQGIAYMIPSQEERLGDGSMGEAQGYSIPESEKDVLAERYEGPSMPAHAGGPQSAIRISEGTGTADGVDEDGDLPTDRETVARLRWKRIALTTAWLARAVPFILVDGESGKVSLDTDLYNIAVEQDKKLAESVPENKSELAAEPAFSQDKLQDVTSEPDDDDYLLGSGDESETVRELKARRRELKALLRQSRGERNEEKLQAFAARTADGATNKRPARSRAVDALAGYTTLVFDTNVLLEAMDIFTALLTSKRWTLVVPLAVVTELDGLRSKADPLGSSASQAIKFLEDAIKTYNMNLKVQTSKGNYLRDLNIRREDIDFGHSTTSAGKSTANGKNGGAQKESSSVKSMDDVILNVAIWQKMHWLDRRALLGIKSATSNEASAPTSVKTILVSSDRTLRLKGKARGLEVCDAAGLQQLLEQPPNG